MKEIFQSVTFSPRPEADPPIELAGPQIRGAKNGSKGLKGRDASLLFFNKKKGTLDTLRRHIDPRPSTQTTADEINFLATPDTSLLTFNKKKGSLELRKRNCAIKDSKGGSEEILQRLESPSATFGSLVFPSGSSIATSLQNRDGTAAAAEQATHLDTEFRSLADYEEQNRHCPPSPNIE